MTTATPSASKDRTISVVVATLNAGQTLEGCLRSIQDQQGVSSEIIVIDGGSEDGTLELLKTLDPHLSYWESTPDAGVYEAWNKALARSSGEWICFLGADDRFASPNALSRLLAAAEDAEAEFASAQVAVVGDSGRWRRIVGEPWDWARMKSFQVIAHPGALHHRSLFRRFGRFSQDYRIAGDYEFLLRLGRLQAAYLDEVTVLMGAEGQSNSNLLRLLRENLEIQGEHPEIGRAKAYLNFVTSLSKGFVTKAWRTIRYRGFGKLRRRSIPILK